MGSRYNHDVDIAAFDVVGAHQSNSTLSAAVALTPPAGATRLLIQAFGANVRYTLDGTAPTATVGFRLTADADPVLLLIGAGMTVTIIQEATGASIQYQWGT